MHHYSITIILSVLLAIVVTAGLVYLTPLKWITFVEPTINNISPQAFYDIYNGHEDDYLFIDVRSEREYNDLHAKGSVNIPLAQFYYQRSNLPKRGKKIVLICSGEAASGVAFSYLQHYGFFNIKRIPGGVPAWNDAGLPVVGKFAK